MTKLLKAIYHSDTKIAQFIADDGRHLLRSGGTLPWRIFNAGDLVSPVNSQGEPNPKHTKNYIGFAHGRKSGNNFFIFPDYETGRAELKASLLRKYINLSIEDTIKKYAPSHQNDTDKYIEDVCKLSSVGKDTKINALNEAQLNRVMDAIEHVEGYHNEVETRKETWVSVSHIQATDGTSPIAGEEIVVKSKGSEKTLKSNNVGYFPPIAHTEHTEIFHRTADADLIKVGDLPADKGQHFSLLTQVAEFFATNAPVKPPENPIKRKHPQLYTVQSGDNLSRIAARFKISVAQLKQDNHLIKNTIMPGQVLGIHSPAPARIAKTQPKRALPKVKKEHKKHTTAPAAQTETLPARSKDGEGEPLALIPPEEGVAPWMKYAIAEAKRWHGEPEGVIQKGKPADEKTGEEAIEGINYHTELGYQSRSMATVAWCAAFVNWCLMQASYPIDKIPHSGRAKAFYMHNDSKTKNPMYIELDEPIYGAVGMVDHGNGKYHVGFVYAKMNDTHIVLLGGNQSDLIRFSPFGMGSGKSGVESTRFFVPLAYAEQARKDAENGVVETANPAVLNKSFGIKDPPPKKRSERVKSDTE